MARWEGRTAFVKVEIGTILCIYETPQIGGQPAPLLRGNHPFSIQTGNEKWISAQISDATSKGAILTLADGSKFSMTPRASDEFDSGITMGGMYCEDWVIRELLSASS
jgi:hypothetical protein